MATTATPEMVTVDPLSNNPTAAFEELIKTQKIKQLPITTTPKPPKPNHLRLVCMSDTHCENENFKFTVPDGDIFIHAGDFTRWGEVVELCKFNEWLKTLPHKHKVVIAGNHELSFDNDCILYHAFRGGNGTVSDRKSLLTDCIYLEDSSVTIQGLKIYGSPWQPEHGGLGFNLPRGEQLLAVWNQIPEDTDILVTHGPPLGHGDRLDTGKRAGCVELLSTVQKRVRPKYHIFGHIHEGYGISTDGTTVFINASTCNRYYVPKNLPIVLDVEMTDKFPLPKDLESNEKNCCLS